MSSSQRNGGVARGLIARPRRPGRRPLPPVRQLHDDEGAAVVLADVEDRHNRRMRGQRGGGARLALEASAGGSFSVEVPSARTFTARGRSSACRGRRRRRPCRRRAIRPSTDSDGQGDPTGADICFTRVRCPTARATVLPRLMARVCHSCGKGPRLRPEPPSHSMVATKRASTRTCRRSGSSRRRAPARVRLHALPEGRQGHQGLECAAPGARGRPEPGSVPGRRRGCARQLEARREEINDLNVFPVADGDTGDNMALTLRAVLDELDRLARRPTSTRSAATRSSSPWRAPRCSARAATAA